MDKWIELKTATKEQIEALNANSKRLVCFFDTGAVALSDDPYFPFEILTHFFILPELPELGKEEGNG